MGYRSDLCIAINSEVKAWSLIANNWPSLLDDADRTDETTCASYYWMDGWKWYESHEEVNAVMKFLDEVENQFDENTAYGFVRIGEEFEDIEVRGEPWNFGVEIHRAIERYSHQ